VDFHVVFRLRGTLKRRSLTGGYGIVSTIHVVYWATNVGIRNPKEEVLVVVGIMDPAIGTILDRDNWS
jgi:hypothetical protein